VHASGLRGAQNRAQISRILDPVQQDEERLTERPGPLQQLFQLDRSARGDQSDDPLVSAGRRDRIQVPWIDELDRDAVALRVGDDPRQRAAQARGARDLDLADRVIGPQSFQNRVAALDRSTGYWVLSTE
jgi:hypothetical protein